MPSRPSQFIKNGPELVVWQLEVKDHVVHVRLRERLEEDRQRSPRIQDLSFDTIKAIFSVRGLRHELAVQRAVHAKRNNVAQRFRISRINNAQLLAQDFTQHNNFISCLFVDLHVLR